MAFNLPFGVRVANNDPVDFDRYLAATNVERDQLITDGRAFVGLQVYVADPAGDASLPPTLFLLQSIGPDLWIEVGGATAAGDRDVQLSGDDGSLINVEQESGDSTRRFFYSNADNSFIFTRNQPPSSKGFGMVLNNFNLRSGNTGNNSTGGNIILQKERYDGGNYVATQSGDTLGRITGAGYSGNGTRDGGYAQFEMNGAISNQNNAIPTDYVLYLSDGTGLSPLEKFRFEKDGGISAPDLGVNSGSGSSPLLVFQGGKIAVSSKAENDVGSGGGALSNAFTIADTNPSSPINTSGGSTLIIDNASSKISVSMDEPSAGDARFLIDIVESQVQHDSLGGFVGSEHINHESVTLVPSNGITINGGTASPINLLAGSKTFALNEDHPRNVDHSAISIETLPGSGLNGGNSIDTNMTLTMSIIRLDTNAGFPPVGNSNIAYERNGNTYRATVSKLLETGLWEDASWIRLSGETNQIFYRMDSKGIVHIRRNQGDSIANGFTTTALPDKYRPAGSSRFFVVQLNTLTGDPTYIEVKATGELVVRALFGTMALTAGFYIQYGGKNQ